MNWFFGDSLVAWRAAQSAAMRASYPGAAWMGIAGMSVYECWRDFTATIGNHLTPYLKLPTGFECSVGGAGAILLGANDALEGRNVLDSGAKICDLALMFQNYLCRSAPVAVIAPLSQWNLDGTPSAKQPLIEGIRAVLANRIQNPTALEAFAMYSTLTYVPAPALTYPAHYAPGDGVHLNEAGYALLIEAIGNAGA